MTEIQTSRRSLSPLAIVAIVLAVLGLAAASIIGTLFVLRTSPSGSSQAVTTTVAPVDPQITAVVAASTANQPTVQPSSTISELGSEPARFYQVSTSVDALNVRATPGTGGELIATLEPGMTGVYTTGRRVSVDGVVWGQIILGDSVDTAAWVSAQYLIADNTTLAVKPSVQCWLAISSAGTRTIALNFDDSTFTGAIRFLDNAGVVNHDRVFGDLTERDYGQALIVTPNNQERMETWFFGESALGNGDTHLGDAVDCNTVAGDVLEIMAIAEL